MLEMMEKVVTTMELDIFTRKPNRKTYKVKILMHYTKITQ